MHKQGDAMSKNASGQWTKSSWSRVLELQPLLKQKLESPEGLSPSDLTKQLRELVDCWCKLAYKKVETILPNPDRRNVPSAPACYHTFFSVHYELLNSAMSRAEKILNAARKQSGLTRLKPSEPVYKQCMVVPAKLFPKVAKSMSNTEIQSAAQRFSPTSRAGGDLPTSSFNNIGRSDNINDLSESVSSGEVGSQDVGRYAAWDGPHQSINDTESETLSSPTPSLMGEVPFHSEVSETTTPSTGLLDSPNIHGQASKSTRRGKRGTYSRKDWNEKKILDQTTQVGKSETAVHEMGDDEEGFVEHLQEVKKRKPGKCSNSAKKTTLRDKPSQVSVQSIQVPVKRQRVNQPAADHPAIWDFGRIAECNCSFLKTENALQLDLGFGTPTKPTSGNDMEPIFMHSSQDTLAALSQCSPQKPLESPQHILKCSSSLFSEFSSCTIAGPTPSLPPTSTPSTSLSGKAPSRSPTSMGSRVLPETTLHTPSVAPFAKPSGSLLLDIENLSQELSLDPGTSAAPAEDSTRIPVWAVSRQELCELPYFKSMQGGVYSRAHTVYGYLLGRFPSPRDAWCHDGRLIISHGGGKNMMNEEQTQLDDLISMPQPKHHLGDDQLETDTSIRGLLRAYRAFRPIVMIAEADFEHLQKFNLRNGVAKEANYYVLGHYAIVAAWAEKEEIVAQGETSSYTRWKFAFQWVEQGQGPPWWLQASTTSPYNPEPPPKTENYETGGLRRTFDRKVKHRGFNTPEVVLNPYPSQGAENKCSTCFTISPKVYLTQWVCLNPDCEQFWEFDNGVMKEAELAFDPGFLSLRDLPEQIQRVPYSIVPEYPAWEGQANRSIFNRHFWAGVCCHNCGRVSCRQKWQIWQCPTCGESKEESRPQVYSSSILTDPLSWENYGNGRYSSELTVTSQVVSYPDGEHRVVVYYKFSEEERVVHVLNNPAVSQAADDLFEQYQKDACEQDMFQRHAIKTHGVKGELYAQHFSFNAGVPYKYIAEGASTPFDQCPDSINKAVGHIQDLCEGALGKHVEFNELLSVAYAEGQEMNFHSDDEPGLGSVVAGLTLGSSAEMIFRPNVSAKKNQIYKNGPYRPSESFSTDAENERVLQITLSHGDLLIMDGENVQKNYEHAVFIRDTDLVRFAATARSISIQNSLPNHLSSKQASHEDATNSASSDIPPGSRHQLYT